MLRVSATSWKISFCLAALLFVSNAMPNRLANAQTIEEHKNCDRLSPPGKYPDYEPMPSYSVKRRQPDSPPGGGLLLGISIPPEAVNSGALARLACKLGSELSAEKKVSAYIFDDDKAAQDLAIYYTEQKGYGAYLWHFKARYTLDRGENSEFLEYVFPTLKDGLLSVRRVKIWLSRAQAGQSSR